MALNLKFNTDIVILSVDDIIQAMDNDGVFKLFTVSIDSRCPNRVEFLWKLLISQLINHSLKRDGSHILMNVYCNENHILTTEELSDLKRKIIMYFNCTLTWGYSTGYSSEIKIQLFVEIDLE
jgi:hypothetical protein